MDKMNFEQEEKVVKDILTPKHLPECKITFREPRHTIWSYARLATIAAAIAAIVAGIILSPDTPNIVEQTHAANNPMERMSQAFEKFINQRSFYIESKTLERIRIGLPVTDDDRMVNCKLYFLQEDSVVYMREEWDDEYHTTAIYDKDSMYLWQNGVMQKSLKIPFRPARYEYLFKSFSNLIKKIGDTDYIVTENYTPRTIEKNTIFKGDIFSNIPIMEIERIEVIKEEQAIKLETKPANKYQPFLTIVYSAEKDKFTSVKIVKEEENGNERKTLMEFKNIVYNYPITVKNITKAPK